MSYKGIDYSLGLANVDKETGIRYGVIFQNSIKPDCTESFESDYGEPTCGKCGNPAVEINDALLDRNAIEDWDRNGQDYACVPCKRTFWSHEAFSDEPLGWNYSGQGYKLRDCLDNDIFVLKSPYYTLAQFCSPCVPGAGNLDTPCEDGPKTYCLGHDWFEEQKAPYPVYSVETGELVEREEN